MNTQPDPAVDAFARQVWQACSFSALLYRWEELPEDWRQNWRALIARSVDSTVLHSPYYLGHHTTVDSTDRQARR
jgi:hypothetical protein